MDTDLELFVLNQTLLRLEDIRLGKVDEDSIVKMAVDYRQGTLDPNFKLSNQISAQNASKALLQKMDAHDEEMLGKRNKRMAARIIELLKEKPDAYFFALGSAHLVGEDNIPDMIRSAGFQVEKVGDSFMEFYIK